MTTEQIEQNVVLTEGQYQLAEELQIKPEYVPIVEKAFDHTAQEILENDYTIMKYDNLHSFFVDIHTEDNDNTDYLIHKLWELFISEDRNAFDMIEGNGYVELPDDTVLELRY